MPKEIVGKFIEQLQQNKEWQRRLEDIYTAELIKIGADNGFSFTEEDVKEWSQAQQSGELGEEELDQIAGGFWTEPIVIDGIVYGPRQAPPTRSYSRPSQY